MAQLRVQNVAKIYPTRSSPLVVLRACSFDLASGENLAIIGPSGSGKSTLLQIVGTLEPPSEGAVLFDGQNPFELSEPRLAQFRNERIGFVFQEHHLLPQCSVLENVLTPTIARGRASSEAVNRARALLDRVGLSERLDHRPSELSGGERQRTAIARALINRPQLLLADEPTGALDRTTATVIAELLLELQREEQLMMIVVTHNAELAQHCARRIELDSGALRAA